MKKWLLLFLPAMGFAQERNELIQQRIEFISEQSETEDPDLTALFDRLNYFVDHPLNLNRADAESLRELGLLTEIQITDLLLHIRRFGKLISMYELQTLAYWDMDIIRLVQPFVRVDDKTEQLHITFREATEQGKTEFYLRYRCTPEQKAAYDPIPDSIKPQSNAWYAGPADAYYTRFRYTYRTNISIGITAEKDAGEDFFDGKQKQGFDFYSAHAYYNGGKYLRSFVAGDYLVQIGQGLNTWTGYAFGKSADVFSSRKAAALIRPHSSSDESRFFRGGAFVAGIGSFSVLGFYSQKKVDGRVETDTLNGESIFGSLVASGLHRTVSENERKHQVGEQIGGAYVQFNRPRVHFGIAGVHQSYNASVQKDLLPYQLQTFQGNQLLTVSGDYTIVVRNLNFFGETTTNRESGKFAHLHGIMAALDPRLSVTLLYRHYASGYSSFYNSGFSEGTGVQNEKGLFAGWKVKLSGAWSLNAYADLFTFPWLKYQVDAPSRGHEYLLQPVFKPNRELEVYFRFREQLRQKNSRDSDGTITSPEEVLQRNYRVHLSYTVNQAISIKSRIEYVSIHRPGNTPESGVLLSQDLVYRPLGSPIDISVRYALFDTDSYDSRIYTFENNALYVYSIPAYYYRGSRAYAMIRWTFLKKCDLWIRYGTFIYENRKSLGTGPEEIRGNQKSDVTVQLRIAF